MKIIKTSIDEVVIIEPQVFGDHRGYFYESFSERDFNQCVRNIKFVQDNQSKSSYGVLRGLHFQKPPHAQSKLVRVVKGVVLDVAVELSEENHRQLFIPRGFAHGFVNLADEVIFQYKCDNFYNPQSEGALAWNDPDIGIDWKIPLDQIVLSEKDSNHPRLCDANWLFDYHDNLYNDL